MAITETITRGGETREIKISGSTGAEFELYVKEGTNYYNWSTNSFQKIEKILKNQKIPISGKYTQSIVIPAVTSDTSYDFYIRTLPGTTSNVSTTNEQKIGVLYQKGSKTATFTATSAASLVIASGLTGGTLNNTKDTLTQTGAITKSGSPLIYVHNTPSWNKINGGNWTNVNKVSTSVISIDGAKVIVKDGSNISSGYAVTGKGIIDEITVSSISGNIITLSAAQNLTQGQTLIFSKSGWEIGPITATISLSGTTSVTMTTSHKIQSVGIADVTSACVIDSFVTVKPNAFPVSVSCPARGNVVINVVDYCTNYLGTRGDNDANQEEKEYVLHSIPTTSTSSIGVAGTISLAADASMGATGVGAVTYTAADDMIAGDTDYFYYKTTDNQDPAVASATTQGKISITIV